jgi:predicted transcriptional regulator YdeE
MDVRISNRNTFYISGYSMETSEENLEKDCAMLREKYEDKLRPISDHLYFLSWMSKESVLIYHFGVEAANLTPATEGATCIEVPAACFAITTVPEGVPILATWHEFFEKGIPSIGASIDMDYSFYFESFDENGVCELGIPVKD